jgi:hypothetical protein
VSKNNKNDKPVPEWQAHKGMKGEREQLPILPLERYQAMNGENSTQNSPVFRYKKGPT